ncbi:MAG TPA: YciI family protein [Ktedonobacteraceae bacterium]
MKYMLLLYGNASQAPHFTSEERSAARQVWFDLLADMKAAGVYLLNYGLSPVTDATTVRVRNGETRAINGPFAETDEQLGGYFLLDCKNLDEAKDWAAKIPHAKFGSIEIRPVITYTEG